MIINEEDKLFEDQYVDISIDGATIQEAEEEISGLDEEEADNEADSLGDNQSAGE